MSNTTEIPDRSDKKAFAEYVASVMKGWAEGRAVDWRDHHDSDWNSEPVGSGMSWDWWKIEYRLAPEAPSVEPWTFETCPLGASIKRKDGTGRFLITGVIERGAVMGSGAGEDADWSLHEFADLLNDFEQLDGTPCGTVASEWPKWFASSDGGDVWQVNKDGSGTYYHNGEQCNNGPAGHYSASILLGTTFPQITPAEAEALIQKARAK